MTNPTVVVTGVTSGVGLAAALVLRERGVNVIGISRGGNDGVAGDLTDPASIRGAVAEIAAKHSHVDGLINAAGGAYWTPGTSGFGVDRRWALNYLGHVLLTNELWPLLEAAPHPRVATVAGAPGLVRRSELHPDFLAADPKSGLAAAGEVLAAKVVWTKALARKRPGKVTPLVFHPGLLRSNLGKGSPLGIRILAAISNVFASKKCAIAADLVLDDKFEGKAGAFYTPNGKSHTFAELEDLAIGDQLWDETEKRLR